MLLSGAYDPLDCSYLYETYEFVEQKDVEELFLCNMSFEPYFCYTHLALFLILNPHAYEDCCHIRQMRPIWNILRKDIYLLPNPHNTTLLETFTISNIFNWAHVYARAGTYVSCSQFEPVWSSLKLTRYYRKDFIGADKPPYENPALFRNWRDYMRKTREIYSFTKCRQKLG